MTTQPRARRGGALRRAMTLVEMLIAIALTLILVYAIAEFYAYIGPSVKDGRAMIDLVAQLRTATSRLRTDLELITVPMGVWKDDGSSMGYFEIREGLRSDLDANGNLTRDAAEAAIFATNNWSTMLGDTDDFLAFTIRSDGAPLTGQVVQVDPANGTPLLDAAGNVLTAAGSSTTAEVAWWTSFSDLDGDQTWDPNETRFLQRRQLLVAPELNQIHPADTNFAGRYYLRVNMTNAAEAHYLLLQQCDVSVRPIGVTAGYTYFVANSLLDLTRRENRFMHVQALWGVFPFGVDLQSPAGTFSDYDGDRTQNRSAAANSGAQWRWVLSGTRLGEDRMLPNLLAFDIRVYDPAAPIRADNVEAVDTNGNANDDAQGTLQPGDPGWEQALANNYPVVGAGTYVDLFYNRQPYSAVSVSQFSGAPAYIGPPGGQAAYLNALGATYDTWALSYERDGIDQLSDGRFDLGTNGFDDQDVNGFIGNGVDDPLERETTPPYPVPLRGIEIRFRAYEPTTRQIRQATIGWDFITE